MLAEGVVKARIRNQVSQSNETVPKPTPHKPVPYKKTGSCWGMSVPTIHKNIHIRVYASVYIQYTQQKGGLKG